MNNTVFLPIEITQREYASKLLLAIELIKKGMPVIIGHKSPVIKLALETKEPGIFFNKGTSAGGFEHTHVLLKQKNFPDLQTFKPELEKVLGKENSETLTLMVSDFENGFLKTKYRNF
jgi:hypothetical protein